MLLTNYPDDSDINNVRFWGSAAEKRICAACGASQFSNLEGSGQSLQLPHNHYGQSDWQVVAGVLEEANIRPFWIEESPFPQMESQRFREHSRVAKDKQTIRHQVAGLNKRIAALKVVVSLRQFHVPYLNLRRAIRYSQGI